MGKNIFVYNGQRHFYEKRIFGGNENYCQSWEDQLEQEHSKIRWKIKNKKVGKQGQKIKEKNKAMVDLMAWGNKVCRIKKNMTLTTRVGWPKKKKKTRKSKQHFK